MAIKEIHRMSVRCVLEIHVERTTMLAELSRDARSLEYSKHNKSTKPIPSAGALVKQTTGVLR